MGYRSELVRGDAGPVGGIVKAGSEEVGVREAHPAYEVACSGVEGITRSAGHRDGHVADS